MIYSEPNAKLARLRPRLDRHATVERLHDLGVLDTVERPYLLKLKEIFDEQVKIATAEMEKIPFAISHRILQVFISRWSGLAKCLDFVANPHNPYGPRVVVNLPNEQNDRKRKADRSSLTASSPSVDEEVLSGMQRQEPAADDNMDRQHPERVAAATPSKSQGAYRKQVLL
jgi:hypothetical protein